MALSPVGVSRLPLLRASFSDFNGCYWTLNDSSRFMVFKSTTRHKINACSAVQESSTSTVSAETKVAKATTKEAPAKPKEPAKAPAKPLPQMMEEDVIPSLRSTLEAQEDISDLELSFQDNKMELKDALKKLKAELKHNPAWVSDEKHEAGQFLDAEPELYLLTTRGDHKALLIAEFALKIAWKMIERCHNLPAKSHRIHFIRSTTFKFLWHFVIVLLLKHEALMTVCAFINAARFCKFKLQAWRDDVLLLGLGIDENGMNSGINGHMMETSGFFDEEIKSFSKLETSWLMEMITHILRQFETLSYEYFHNLHRFDCLLKDVDRLPAMNAILFVNLVEALDNLSSQLLLLRQHIRRTFWICGEALQMDLTISYFIAFSQVILDYPMEETGHLSYELTIGTTAATLH